MKACGTYLRERWLLSSISKRFYKFKNMERIFCTKKIGHMHIVIESISLLNPYRYWIHIVIEPPVLFINLQALRNTWVNRHVINDQIKIEVCAHKRAGHAFTGATATAGVTIGAATGDATATGAICSAIVHWSFCFMYPGWAAGCY